MLFYDAVFDVIAEKTVQVTNEEQHIVWEGYGLRMHIPPNSLPDHCTHFQLNMAVALSGHFTFPENGILVSGVYSFRHDLGDNELRHPVMVEMQHCASANAVNGLCIVRADENSDAPYEFKIISGGTFNHSDSYGAIKLHHFCRIATFLWWRLKSLICPLEYCAKLYYTNIEPGGFDYHLYIIPNLTMILRVGEIHFVVLTSLL